MNLIVAEYKNWGIGNNNKLLVSIPSDMKFFRQETSGKVVVMGRKTLESFPNGSAVEEQNEYCCPHQRSFLSGEGCDYCSRSSGTSERTEKISGRSDLCDRRRKSIRGVAAFTVTLPM